MPGPAESKPFAPVKVSILDKATGYMDHVIKETIDISLHPRNFNMDGGFTLSWSW
jgi:hypothetical protein